MAKKMSQQNRAIWQEIQEGSRLRTKANQMSQRSLAWKFDRTPWEIRKALMDGSDDLDSELIAELAKERDELRRQLEPYAYPAIAQRHGVTRNAVEKVASRMRDKEGLS